MFALHVDHDKKLTEVPDEYLTNTLPIAKKISAAVGTVNYHLLQVCVFYSMLCSSHLLHILDSSIVFRIMADLRARNHHTFTSTSSPNDDGGLPIGWLQQ